MYKYIQDFYTLSGIKYLIGGIDRFASPISLSSRIRLDPEFRGPTPVRKDRREEETKRREYTYYEDENEDC